MARGSFTQQDPIGLEGGMNLYGFAGGDPVNYTDPFGLKVEFTGDQQAGRATWNSLLNAANKAARSKDATVAEAGRLLAAAMDEMWNDPTVVYSVNFRDWTPDQLKSDGGGFSACGKGIPKCFVSVATNGALSGLQTTLAHEAGGALGQRKGVDHYANNGALRWENYARQIFGCKPRPAPHGPPGPLPTLCR